MKLKEKVAVVTGGGSGLGAEIALQLVAQGAKVALVGATERKLDAVRETIRTRGGEAAVFVADVSDENRMVQLFSEVEAVFGGIDILYNNAGVSPEGTIETTTFEAFQKVVEIDLYGIFLGSKYVIPYMKKRGGGVIINTVGTFGLRPIPNKIGYSAAKAGAMSLTRSVAAEMAKDNIRCNAVCPGFVDTPLNKGFVGEAREKFLDAHQPMALRIDSADIANMAVFLATEDARAITGQGIVIDGGTEACLYF
ncbi:MAG: SDR family oxidoreductase [Clostridiales Family XIII bacterium]|jgi:3-oxoacyl-[acyl-carrier protein] reductase|nr:SDR family oxidoreductase [Clostridiales Family XIII bacterium]